MPAKPLSDADHHHLAQFRYLLRQFLAFSENEARKTGLSPQQHQALLAIRGFGGRLSVGALASRLVIKPNSAVGLANRLIESGLAKRKVNDSDHRRIELTLTPAGERKLAQLSHAHRSELTRLGPSLLPLLKK